MFWPPSRESLLSPVHTLVVDSFLINVHRSSSTSNSVVKRHYVRPYSRRPSLGQFSQAEELCLIHIPSLSTFCVAVAGSKMVFMQV